MFVKGKTAIEGLLAERVDLACPHLTEAAADRDKVVAIDGRGAGGYGTGGTLC
jgi:hypothetical protein